MKKGRVYDLEEASSCCGISQELIIHFVKEEWVRPVEQNNMTLDEEDLARIRLVRTLIEEMELQEDSLSVVLHLIDEINHLRFLLRDRGPSELEL